MGQIYFGDQAGKWVRIKSALTDSDMPLVTLARAHIDIGLDIYVGACSAFAGSWVAAAAGVAPGVGLAAAAGAAVLPG